jgi:bile acid:Na+ symporter, BASS family
MFGVAIELSLDDFKRIAEYPKSVLAGIFSQFFILPALTFLLVLLWQPSPSIALGLILVAACPGGNISNFFSLQAGGNAALSVTLTAFATLMAVVATPFNLQFWGNLYPPTAALITQVNLDFTEALKAVFVVLGIPLVAGVLIKQHYPYWAHRYGKLIRKISIFIFIAFILIAFGANYQQFISYIAMVFVLVMIHNALAIAAGFGFATMLKLPFPDRKTLAIETGIQNSGLGLLLIFTFFEGLGGMALVAAWWGIWHMVSGLLMSFIWAPKTALSKV